MTVHAIQIVTGVTQQDNPDVVPAPEPPSIPDVVPQRVEDNVLANHAEVLTGQNSPATHVAADADLGISEHMRALHRFDASEDKTALLDAFEGQVAADIEWYEIRYHECEHDVDQPIPPCPGWVAERSYGSVPSGA